MKARLDSMATRRAERIAARVAPHLPAEGRVLDVGSGTGHNAQALRQATRLTFVETDVVDMHAVGPGPILCEDAKLPFPDNGFDAAIVCHVLQFPADSTALLTDTARVAPRVVVLQSTSGGTLGRALLVARGFVFGRLAFRIARLAGFVGPSEPSALAVRRVLSREDVRSAATAAGLREAGFEPDKLPVPFGGRDLFVFERVK